MLLRLSDIDTYYGLAQALSGISLEIEDGEIVTILGANGAGKTTTLLTISGIIRPRDGSVYYRGEPIQGKKPATIVKMGIAHCPEGREIFPDMTVLDNLRLGAFLRKDRNSVEQDLKMVYERFPRLQERERQMAGSLSGGEQQMLAIGRALMSNPLLLLLDEPSLGLAPIMVEEMFRIIREINGDGKSVLLVEQNVAVALDVAKRGYVLETGRIVFSGSRHDLVNNPSVRKAYLGG
jgi:branched-chain amino acid transport system ATP-binding protein